MKRFAVKHPKYITGQECWRSKMHRGDTEVQVWQWDNYPTPTSPRSILGVIRLSAFFLTFNLLTFTSCRRCLSITRLSITVFLFFPSCHKKDQISLSSGFCIVLSRPQPCYPFIFPSIFLIVCLPLIPPRPSVSSVPCSHSFFVSSLYIFSSPSLSVQTKLPLPLPPSFPHQSYLSNQPE